jgi:hypothetical protein
MTTRLTCGAWLAVRGRERRRQRTSTGRALGRGEGEKRGRARVKLGCATAYWAGCARWPMGRGREVGPATRAGLRGRKGEGRGARLGPIVAAMAPLRELGPRGESGLRGRKGKGSWATQVRCREG